MATIALPRAGIIDDNRIIYVDMEMENETVAALPLERYKTNIDLDDQLYPLFSVIEKSSGPNHELTEQILKAII